MVFPRGNDQVRGHAVEEADFEISLAVVETGNALPFSHFDCSPLQYDATVVGIPSEVVVHRRRHLARAACGSTRQVGVVQQPTHTTEPKKPAATSSSPASYQVAALAQGFFGPHLRSGNKGGGRGCPFSGVTENSGDVGWWC